MCKRSVARYLGLLIFGASALSSPIAAQAAAPAQDGQPAVTTVAAPQTPTFSDEPSAEWLAKFVRPCHRTGDKMVC